MANTREHDADTAARDETVETAPSDESKRNDNDRESEVASLRERLMRALAETENTRRRAERRAQDIQQYAISDFARELLQVVDNLRRAVEAGTADQGKQSSDPLVEGVAATDRVLTQVLNRFGVREIDAANEPFDPKKHEAVMETDETEQPPGNVAQVLETGYTLHDRLLRPARVVVAKPQQHPSQSAEQ